MQKPQETQVLSLGREDPLEQEMAAHSRIAWRIHGQRSLAGTVYGVAKSQTRLKRLGSSHKVNGRTVSARSPVSCAVRAVHQHWHWQAHAHGAPTVPETFQNLCLVPGPAPPVTSDFTCSFKWKCPVKRSIREASHTRLKRAGELLVFSTQGCVPGNGSSLRSDMWSHEQTQEILCWTSRSESERDRQRPN